MMRKMEINFVHKPEDRQLTEEEKLTNLIWLYNKLRKTNDKKITELIKDE